jgi:chloride channel protein, CIC family
LILAVLMYIFPPLFGEGYESIRLLADGNTEVLLKNSIFSEYRFQNSAIILFIGAIVFVKAIATSVTLSSGGNGGNFAPSLFVGSFLGFCFAYILNTVFGLDLPLGNFTIVGMAGVLSGVFYAPLTGIFLIAEVTGGYELIIPLMIVSTISSVFIRHFEPVSLEMKNMIEKGEVFSQDKDRNILLLLKTLDIIETDFKTIQPTARLRDLIEVIKHSKRNLYAVVNKNGQLEGILTLDDVREVMFDIRFYDKLLVKNLMKSPPSVLEVNESMSDVMKKFDETQAWNLPVVDAGQYVGFISKSAIFSKYRGELMSMNKD